MSGPMAFGLALGVPVFLFAGTKDWNLAFVLGGVAVWLIDLGWRELR